jgi:hypothetical protein
MGRSRCDGLALLHSTIWVKYRAGPKPDRARFSNAVFNGGIETSCREMLMGQRVCVEVIISSSSRCPWSLTRSLGFKRSCGGDHHTEAIRRNQASLRIVWIISGNPGLTRCVGVGVGRRFGGRSGSWQGGSGRATSLFRRSNGRSGLSRRCDGQRPHSPLGTGTSA